MILPSKSKSFLMDGFVYSLFKTGTAVDFFNHRFAGFQIDLYKNIKKFVKLIKFTFFVELFFVELLKSYKKK